MLELLICTDGESFYGADTDQRTLRGMIRASVMGSEFYLVQTRHRPGCRCTETQLREIFPFSFALQPKTCPFVLSIEQTLLTRAKWAAFSKFNY